MTATRVELAWSPSSPLLGVREYRVYRDGRFIGSSADTTFADTGLVPSTRYSYRVSTVDNAGIEGARSDPLTTRTASDDDDDEASDGGGSDGGGSGSGGSGEGGSGSGGSGGDPARDVTPPAAPTDLRLVDVG